MFDTMTLTKIAAGLFGAWLILLLGKWAGEEIYHADSHGEPSYVIAVADAAPAESEEIDFAALMAEADAEKGAKVFRKCSACHKVADGENGAGPHLYGIVGRDKAAVDGFAYSSVLAGMDGDWSVENLNEFLTKPSSYAPGTSMSFPGLKKVDDRADVIAYLLSVAE